MSTPGKALPRGNSEQPWLASETEKRIVKFVTQRRLSVVPGLKWHDDILPPCVFVVATKVVNIYGDGREAGGNGIPRSDMPPAH